MYAKHGGIPMTDPEILLTEVRDKVLAEEEVTDDEMKAVVDHLRAKREERGGRGPAKKKTAAKKTAAKKPAAPAKSLKDIVNSTV